MTDDIDKDMKKLMDELDEGTGFTSEDVYVHERKRIFSPGSGRKILFLGALIVVIVVAVFIALPRGGNDSSPQDLVALKVKISRLENTLKGTKDLVSRLEVEGHQLQQLALKTDNSVKSMEQQMATLAKRIASLTKTPKTEKPKVSAKTPVPPAVVKKQFHEVSRGENLYRISLKYGLTVKELCGLNNMTSRDPIQPGQKLIVGPNSR